eukprot:s218_g4.t2
MACLAGPTLTPTYLGAAKEARQQGCGLHVAQAQAARALRSCLGVLGKPGQELVGGNGTIEQARSLGVHPASSTQPGFAGRLRPDRKAAWALSSESTFRVSEARRGRSGGLARRSELSKAVDYLPARGERGKNEELRCEVVSEEAHCETDQAMASILETGLSSRWSSPENLDFEGGSDASEEADGQVVGSVVASQLQEVVQAYESGGQGAAWDSGDEDVAGPSIEDLGKANSSIADINQEVENMVPTDPAAAQ